MNHLSAFYSSELGLRHNHYMKGCVMVSIRIEAGWRAIRTITINYAIVVIIITTTTCDEFVEEQFV